MSTLQRLASEPLASLCAGFLVLLAVVAVCAPLLVGNDPSSMSLSARLQPPMGFGGRPDHPLGTDGLGRDILARLVYGARVSLLVAVASVSLSCGLGVTFGLLAAYYRGPLDDTIMRLADIQLAFPAIILFIGVLAVLGPGLGNLIWVLGLSGWVVYGRVVRGAALSLREREFVVAARTLGAADARILSRHILPNVFAPVIVLVTFSAAAVVIAEASLSFLGLGVPATIPSWGSMLADGQETIRQAWWPSTFPGLAIALTTLAINTLGDWLRDTLDPRLRV